MLKFTAPKEASWQSHYNMLFASDRNRVTCNLMFKTDDYRLVPFGCRDPKDWDVIIPGFYLAVGVGGVLNVDSGTPDDPMIETSAMREDTRTLMDCFRHTLSDYYYTHKEHYSKVHPSWHGWVLGEDMKPIPLDDDDSYM